ncbi:DNA/RNA polymerases superfamily protein [Gossypium australe]|uniref:DNA/RNA polymerases superfamily protein n=1 Tax=Gossypium australe TaxID=47621 RepID=A0A5B6VLT5_9ROSI|nr:DNA/RNA polymerases superfamily protein [Gossypium australe]
MEIYSSYSNSETSYKKLWSSTKFVPCEVLYGHKCKTPVFWTELSEKIYIWLFQIGDKIFLKVLPWKKVLQFGHKGKSSLWFIGLQIDRIHNVFHVYMCVTIVSIRPIIESYLGTGRNHEKVISKPLYW